MFISSEVNFDPWTIGKGTSIPCDMSKGPHRNKKSSVRNRIINNIVTLYDEGW